MPKHADGSRAAELSYPEKVGERMPWFGRRAAGARRKIYNIRPRSRLPDREIGKPGKNPAGHEIASWNDDVRQQ